MIIRKVITFSGIFAVVLLATNCSIAEPTPRADSTNYPFRLSGSEAKLQASIQLDFSSIDFSHIKTGNTARPAYVGHNMANINERKVIFLFFCSEISEPQTAHGFRSPPVILKT